MYRNLPRKHDHTNIIKFRGFKGYNLPASSPEIDYLTQREKPAAAAAYWGILLRISSTVELHSFSVIFKLD